MIKKILIANRGEIACRIIKSAQKLGIKTVAICSEVDLLAPHVIMADEYVNLGGSKSSESYLDINKIIQAVISTKADAVHPGYGFLSENLNFCNQINKINKIFIGPPSNAIDIMGDKIKSKKLAFDSGVSVVPGGLEIIDGYENAFKEAKKIKFPVIIKASAGGGGKGMRVVYNEIEFKEKFNSAVNEAKSSFGDERVFIEKFIENPRHIEIQVFGDQFGNIIHLGERECSIQRRHQKVIEEAPSKFVDEDLRNKMASQAIMLAKAVEYYSAGTVEFVVDEDKNFYFLEMNTRLQVEHPVTELITGIDLVELMIKIASKKKLALTQKDVKFSGWAVEARIYAEDSARKFLPSIGRLTRYIEPKGKNIRLDSGVVEGSEISMFYDPMISKLCVHSKTRMDAIDIMVNALDRYLINGVNTNKEFLSSIFQNNSFIKGEFTTNFIEENYIDGFDTNNSENVYLNEMMAVATFIHFKYMMRASSISNKVKSFLRDVSTKWNVIMKKEIFKTKINYNNYNQNFDIFVNEKYFKLKSDWKIGFPLLSALVGNKLLYFEIERDGPKYKISHKSSTIEVLVFSNRHAELNKIMIPRQKPDTSKFLLSPMPGLLCSVLVKKGQVVEEGQSLVVLEAMKMENIIKAEKEVKIKEIFCKEGDSLLVDQSIIEFE